MDLTLAERRQFMVDACHVHDASPSEAHRALLQLPPRCFVTTNYDVLLEQALSLYRPAEYYQVITNRQPVDQPTILRATATHFVFKPHGHVTDLESIILTREDYRRLAHDLTYTLRTLGTLLVTRPVIFVGCGLRDPDFLMVLDAIAEDYRGGAQEHYCLTLNPHPDEVRYWRETYGVHLIGYPDAPVGDSNPHSQLLPTLVQLATNYSRSPTTPASEIPSSDQTLALIRLAARNRRLTDSAEGVDVIPLRLAVREAGDRPRKWNLHRSTLYSSALGEFDGRVFVYGPPGAGKSFGALCHIRRLATELLTKCAADDTPFHELVLPVYVPLRLYGGDLQDLVEQELPAGLDPSELVTCKLFIVLDGANEVPQAHLDDGSFFSQLDALLTTVPFQSATVLMLGRAIDEAPRDFLVFELDEIDHAWLFEHLPSQLTEGELWRPLVRPIIYRMVRDGIVSLSEAMSPADFYKGYFSQLVQRLGERLSTGALQALSAMAFDTVAEGSQAISFARVVTRLGRHHADPKTLGARLVDLEFLQPVAGSRVVFPHHSFLEYLAALELAHREVIRPGTVTDLLTQRSWDYVAVLAASVTDGDARRSIITQLVQVDIRTAVRAVLYAGSASPAVVSEILTAIPNLWPSAAAGFSLGNLVTRLPVGPEHDGLVKFLLELPGGIGAVGAALFVKLRGRDGADTIINALVQAKDDYNKCSGIGHALAPIMDLRTLATLLTRLEAATMDYGFDWSTIEDGSPEQVLSTATADAMEALPPSEVLSAVSPDSATGLRLRILTSWLWDNRSVEGLQATLTLLRRGERAAIFPFYSYLAFPRDLDPSEFHIDEDTVTTLIRFAGDPYFDEWAAQALVLLGHLLPSTREVMSTYVSSSDGILELLLTLASGGATALDYAQEVEDIITSLLGDPNAHWNLVDALDLSWEEFPSLFEKILRSEDVSAIAAIGEIIQTQAIPTIDVSDVAWWLAHIGKVANHSEWAAYLLARVVGRLAAPDDELRIVRLLDHLDEQTQLVIVRLLLPALSAITTDDLSPSLTSVLLKEELAHSGNSWWAEDSALSRMATEDFVERVLIPIVDGDPDEVRRGAAARILEAVGQRHGRRYVGSSGQVLG